MLNATGLRVLASQGAKVDSSDFKDADEFNDWLRIDDNESPVQRNDPQTDAAFEFAKAQEERKREARM